MSKYIIGDIHGCFNTFFELTKKIQDDGGKLSDIVLVGDLVDRGKDSMLVVEFVKTNNIPCVRGNHEQMMIDWFDKSEYRDGIWEQNGGTETLLSYGNNHELLKSHVEFIKTLPLYLEFPEEKYYPSSTSDPRYLVVSHSNIGKVWDWSPERRVAMKDQFENGIMWERNWFEDVPEIYNIVGHTPVEVPKIKSFYVNVDTGCVFNRGLFTKLSCLKFPEMVVLSQDNIENE